MIGGIELFVEIFMVDAYVNGVFGRKVIQVRLEAIVESNVVTYEVVISVLNPDLSFKSGLTANVAIYTLEKEHILTLPLKALKFILEEQLAASSRTIGFFSGKTVFPFLIHTKKNSWPILKKGRFGDSCVSASF